MTRVYTEEQKQRRRDLQKKYRNTEEYKAKRRLYENTHKNTPEGKVKKKEYQSKYLASEEYKLKQKEKYRSPTERAKSFFKTISRRAKDNGYDFDLTLEWLEDRLTKGVCGVSTIPFILDSYGNRHSKFYSPSVDRIDNNRGYTMDNCRMVLFAFNAGKHTGTDQDFIRLVEGLISSGFVKGYNKEGSSCEIK